MKYALAGLLVAALLTGCASDRAFHEGQRLMSEGHSEAGLKQLAEARLESPNDLAVRAAYIHAQEVEIQRLLGVGDHALAAGQYDAAVAAYRRVLELHPQDARAPAGLAAVAVARKDAVLVREASEAIRRHAFGSARTKLQIVLAQEPDNRQARGLQHQAEIQSGLPDGVATPRLNAEFRQPITLEFRDAPLRTVLDAISQRSGLNFILDKEVNAQTAVTVFARDTSISHAVDMFLATNQLARKVLSGNTLLIYPDTPAKQDEYQDQVIKGFFLTNSDAKTTLSLIKTMVKTRDVFIDPKLNLLVAKATPEAMRLIEKLVAVQDRPQPEVMLDVEVLEVSRSMLQNLGVQWPNQFGVLNVVDSTSVVAGAVGAPVSTTTQVASSLPLTLNQILLNNLKKSSNISVSPSPQIDINGQDSDVNLLANPRIRVVNRQKATIHIGDRVPVITSNVTATGVTSESVNYMDVGLKLEVQPQVYLDDDVGIDVNLEVSNIVQAVKSATGTLTYQLGTRNATTELRLKDGETQVLAGLISDQDRANANKIPGLGDLPLIGRLFSDNSHTKNKSEVVLLITPHILRNIQRPDLAEDEFFAGTEAVPSDRPLIPGPVAAPKNTAAPAAKDAVSTRPLAPAEMPSGMPEVPVAAQPAVAHDAAEQPSP